MVSRKEIEEVMLPYRWELDCLAISKANQLWQEYVDGLA